MAFNFIISFCNPELLFNEVNDRLILGLYTALFSAVIIILAISFVIPCIIVLKDQTVIQAVKTWNRHVSINFLNILFFVITCILVLVSITTVFYFFEFDFKNLTISTVLAYLGFRLLLFVITGFFIALFIKTNRYLLEKTEDFHANEV